MKLPFPLFLSSSTFLGVRGSWSIDEFHERAHQINAQLANYGPCDTGAIASIRLGAGGNCPAFRAINDAFDLYDNNQGYALDRVYMNAKSGEIDVDDFQDLAWIQPEDDNDESEYGCEYEAFALRIGSSEPGPEIGRRVNENCLSGRMDEIGNIRQNFDVEAYVQEQCLEETTAIEDLTVIADAYSSTTPVVDSIVVNDTYEVVFMNYTGSTTAYEEACIASGGTFSELSFGASCDEMDNSDQIVFTEVLDVIDFPRCYGMNCSVFDFDSALFERFTLEATESRSRSATRGDIWLCTGTLYGENVNMTTQFCESATAAIEAAQDLLVETYTSTNSTVETPGFFESWSMFWARVFGTAPSTLTFTNTETFETACKSLSGSYGTEDMTAVCIKSNIAEGTVEEEGTYEVGGFPICTGNACGDSDFEGVTYEGDLSVFMTTDATLSSDGASEWTCESGAIGFAFAAAIAASLGVTSVLWFW